MSVSLAGGAPVKLASGLAKPFALAVDSTHAYVLTVGLFESDGDVTKISLADSKSTVLASGFDFHGSAFVPLCVDAIAVDSTSVYWTAAPLTIDLDGTLQKISLLGGTPVVLLAHERRPCGVAIDRTNIYWTNLGTGKFDDGTVMKATLDGQNSMTLTTNLASPSAIVSDGTHIFVTAGVILSADGTLVRVPAAGGGAPWSLALSGDDLYWSEGDAIKTVPLAGGDTSILVSWPPDTVP